MRVSLTPNVGNQIQLRIEGGRGDGNESDMAIDDITMDAHGIPLNSSELSAKEHQIHLFPNPASQLMNINSPEIVESVEVFSLNGSLIERGIIFDRENQQIDVSKLPGEVVYAVILRTNIYLY